MANIEMDKIVAHCKNVGYIFPGSDIYGGLANTWDYGPLGVELKNNIKQVWWKKFVQERENSYGVDCAILMNPRVWEASGHVASFSDPLMDCKECKARFRADNLISNYSHGEVNPDLMTKEEMSEYVQEHHVPCPVCGKSNFTPIRQFNLLFKTQRGVTSENALDIYLRPETAQGEYVNFLNVQRSMRAKVPFGIGQIGKAFRNEITPGNFTFRQIEFEQMEYQFFCHADEDEKYYEEFKKVSKEFFVSLGIPEEKLKFHDHDKLAFYAKAACDVYYQFPFGWDEVNGIHNRTNYDLTKHQEYSGKNMEYLDPITNEKFIPNVIENSYGLDRAILAVICNAYDVETLPDGEVREIMRLSPRIAPFKVAVLPLIKRDLSDKAHELFKELAKDFRVTYDETGTIGKRYRRQDQIGTPLCVTVDFDTLQDNTVTVRDRDTMEQIRMPISELKAYIANIIK
ncbi:MAG: glycine--tRNA ligase [Firmicutes bacterium]|nr:glycine--tRNA ligase [Bacillota bacterium]